MSMILPLAHAGHWIVSFLYVLPVLILVGALIWQRRRDEGAEDTEDDDSVFADGAWDDDF